MRWLLTCLAFAATPVVAADVYVLGEVHDNPAHHLQQAALIAEIEPTVIVFEMMTPDQATIAMTLSPDDPDFGEKVGWEARGWPDFDIYRPLFMFDTPLFGAALPRDAVVASMTKGAAEVFGDGAEQFGLTEIDPRVEEAMLEEQEIAHCNALPPEMLPGMVEAQRLRDAAFARETLRALEQTGGPVVLITGNGHARTDRAVPAVIAKAEPTVIVHSIGILESEADNAPFDQVYVTEPHERPDPCLAFQ